MAIANPSVITVVSNTPQQLYTITTPFPNVPSFNSIGNQVTMTFNSTLTQTTATGASISLTTEVITLQPNITYQMTAVANIANTNQPSQYAFVNSTGATLGLAQPFGQTLTITTSSASTQTFTILASTIDGSPWLYPAQISNVVLTVQALAGWTI